MSVDGDNKKHESTIEDLLRAIIVKLDILILHNEEISDQIFTEEDIENGDN